MKIIECPRDAMQGLHEFVPTELKIEYINLLLKAGFDTVDFGSFVSDKAIPQMRDTAQVLEKLDLDTTQSKLLVIIANLRGAKEALKYEEIDFLGFPLSVSETFQQRNTHKTIEEALAELAEIKNLCEKHKKTLVTYISMAFGNPYGDPWNLDVAEIMTEKLKSLDLKTIALADTVGMAQPEDIDYLFSGLISSFPDMEFGAHLHTTSLSWKQKTAAAFEAGCRRFDGALRGYGGCPMAKDELVGNLATENIIQFMDEREIDHGVDHSVLLQSLRLADKIVNGNK